MYIVLLVHVACAWRGIIVFMATLTMGKEKAFWDFV